MPKILRAAQNGLLWLMDWAAPKRASLSRLRLDLDHL
jgi:hypothetical protein